VGMFELRLTPDSTGETFDVSAGMRDVVMWEKTHRGRSLAQIGEGNLSAVMIYELAFAACRRQQLIPRELTEQEFNDTYEIDVETPDEHAARLRAEALRDRIAAGEVEVPPRAEGEPFNGFTPQHSEEPADGMDPTRPEA
jgi:hypothetical protein